MVCMAGAPKSIDVKSKQGIINPKVAPFQIFDNTHSTCLWDCIPWDTCAVCTNFAAPDPGNYMYCRSQLFFIFVIVKLCWFFVSGPPYFSFLVFLVL